MDAIERPPVVVSKIERRHHPGVRIDHNVRAGIEGMVRCRSHERVALSRVVGITTAEKRPGALNKNDIDRDSLIARVLCEELPIRIDGGFDRTQHGNFSSDAIRLDSQCHVGSHDGHRRMLDVIGCGAKRRTRQNDDVGIDRQCQKTTSRFLLHVRRHRTRALNRFTKLRPKFVTKVALHQAKLFGRVIE